MNKIIKITTFLIGVFFLMSFQKENLENGLYAKINTSKGEIVVKLEMEKAPLTVANFVALAEGNHYLLGKKKEQKPFYDGLKFHRVIKNFMIQGGDPKGTGAGGPGYSFPDEFNPDLKHDRAGTLAMANAGPNTNGSQFYITHKATKWLDNKHTVFGYVIKGQEVVNEIVKGDKINSIKIIRVGKLARKFKANKVFKNTLAEIEENVRKEKQKSAAAFKLIKEKEALATILPSGLKIYFDKKTEEVKPVKKDKVKIHYTGYLRDGSKFDSSVDRNQPFETLIGVGMVIKGWDQGVVEMPVGSKAIFYIPSKLAYGKRAMGKVIPANSDLIFEVELLEILPKKQ